MSQSLISNKDITTVLQHMTRTGVSVQNKRLILELLQGQKNPRKNIVDAISGLFKKNPTIRVAGKLLDIGIHADWDALINSYGKYHYTPYHPDRNPDEYFSLLVYAYHRQTGGRAFMYDHTTQSQGADRIIDRLNAAAGL